MTYLIIGMILTGLGIISTIIGTFKQGEEEKGFQDEIISYQQQSIDLAKELAKKNEDQLKLLTKPVINVVGIKELNDSILVKSYFEISVKNTGNNDAINCKLFIDSHNSPLVGTSTIHNFVKIPKGSGVEYKIPFFFDQITWETSDKKTQSDFNDIFMKKYNNDEIYIAVHFHFEFEWNGEEMKSSPYIIMKSIKRDVYLAPIEDKLKTKNE